MRGAIAVLSSIFVAMIVFGLFAGPVLEAVVDLVLGFDVVADNHESTVTGIIRVTLVYGPLLIIGGSILGAIRWYLSRERVSRRVR